MVRVTYHWILPFSMQEDFWVNKYAIEEPGLLSSCPMFIPLDHAAFKNHYLI